MGSPTVAEGDPLRGWPSAKGPVRHPKGDTATRRGFHPLQQIAGTLMTILSPPAGAPRRVCARG